MPEESLTLCVFYYDIQVCDLRVETLEEMLHVDLLDIFISSDYKVNLLRNTEDQKNKVPHQNKVQMVLKNTAYYNASDTAVMSETWTLKITLPFFTERVLAPHNDPTVPHEGSIG